MGKGKDKVIVKLKDKLGSLTNNIENIQKVGMWINFHKRYAPDVILIWKKYFEKASDDKKLTYIYLANEIVQTCKRRDAIIYKEAFKNVLMDVAQMFDGSQLKKKVERVFSIWQERKVYDKSFCQKLKASLVSSPSDSPTEPSPPPVENQENSLSANVEEPFKVNAKELEDFNHEVLLDQLRSFINLETETSAKFAQLDASRLDSSITDAVRHLKDREHGAEFKQQFEDACAKLEEYVISLDREVKERTRLVEDLRVAQAYYDAQFGDVKVVVTAYRRYGQMIEKMKQRLAAKMDSLPEEFVPSVDIEDAPSPGNTPPQLRHGIQEDIGAEVALLSRKEEDMDMEDDSEMHRNSSVFGRRGAKRPQQQNNARNYRTDGSSQPERRNKQDAGNLKHPRYHNQASPSNSMDSAPSPPSDYDADELTSAPAPPQSNISLQLRNLRDASSRNSATVFHNQQSQVSSIHVVGSGFNPMTSQHPLPTLDVSVRGHDTSGGGGNTPTLDEANSGGPATPGTAMNFLSSLLPDQGALPNYSVGSMQPLESANAIASMSGSTLSAQLPTYQMAPPTLTLQPIMGSNSMFANSSHVQQQMTPDSGWNHWRQNYAQTQLSPFLPPAGQQIQTQQPHLSRSSGTVVSIRTSNVLSMPQPPPPPPLPPTPPRFLQQRGAFNNGVRPTRGHNQGDSTRYRYTAPTANSSQHKNSSVEVHVEPSRTVNNSQESSYAESRPIETIGGGSQHASSQGGGEPNFRPFALRGRGAFSRNVRPTAFETNDPNGGGPRHVGQGRGQMTAGNMQMRSPYRGNRGGGGGGYRFGHPLTQQFSH